MTESTEPGPAALPATTPAGRARARALDGLSPLPEPMQWVEYHSSGRLLIIGPADDAWPLAKVLAERMTCAILATQPPAEPPESAPPARYLDGRPRELSGHLGAFTLKVEVDRGRVLDAAAAFGIESDTFDLVLDLDGSGGMRMDVAPPGYYRAVTDAERQQALTELPDLIGEFQKPRYFDYKPEICAHGASGITGCSNCLEVCATEAITSAGDRIEVDPYLCQGCGSCTTVCPSGAIRYQAPDRGELLTGAQRLLVDYRAAAGTETETVPAPELLLYNAGSAAGGLARHAPELPEHVIPVPVEDVGAIGLESWLSLLAFGAARVLLLPGPEPAPSLGAASRSQLDVLDPLLRALGDAHAAERVVWLSGPDAARRLQPLPAMVGEPAAFDGRGYKRVVARQALAALHAQAVLQGQPDETVALPAGAPYGDIEVDRDACTLCMACVSICPATAVQGGGELPRLLFREERCLQCGLCAQACPEDAIGLRPRMHFAAHVRPGERVLNEAEMHHCPDCGKPFATRALIDRMRERLSDHWMFATDQARERLLRCEDCRIRNLWEQEGGFDLHKPGRD
ncbi:MAG: 4Fe-4S binding protein [Wenzhouxiangellaceae bacterium]|nr:4Fe-4S binding protein [Wenzhouxiangellaceae bacterium]